MSQHQRQVATTSTENEIIRASVLVPLVVLNNELHVLLTVRTHEVETHKGQISFPGGMCDEKDANETETALREAKEEIGLPKSSVEILGILDDFVTPTGFLITPVVGYIQSLPLLKPNPEEVAEVLFVPPSFFADEQNGRTEERTVNGKHLKVWFFDYQQHAIWGATAGIIKHFLNIIQDKP
ncbi:MAG: CoA pyrophosphatase [Ignavibacteriae bacterium]|nr:CoA pyrophosphatase [Ignavibacteriota bacterium]